MVQQQTDLAPSLFEKALALLSAALLILVVVALGRGMGEWGRMPFAVWLHVATVGFALLLTPIQLLRKRGDALHKWLGAAWAAAMFTTGVGTFWIRMANDGALSWIHIFSVMVIVSVPLLIWFAHKGRIEDHRNTVQGLTGGGLMIAGYFTLLPDRILGSWLWG